MKAKCLALLAVLLFLSGAAFAQQVSVDWDHNVTDFSKYRTYAWSPARKVLPDQLMDQRIVGDIDSQLAAKGLAKVDQGQNPDLIVTYGIGVRQRRSEMITGMGGWRWGGGMAEVNPEVEDIGTLIIQLSDLHARQLIWRGTMVDALSDDNPQKNSQKLEKGIAKLFKDYPPKSKK
jgi:hypothetical protein